MKTSAGSMRIVPLALAACLLAGPGRLGAEVPKGVATTVAACPGNVRAIAWVPLDPSVPEALFDALPMGATYRQVLTGRCATFKAKTGLDPLHDLRGLAVAVAAEKADAKPDQVLVLLETGIDPAPFMKALAADPATRGLVKVEGDHGSFGPVAFKTTPTGVFFGLPPTLAGLRAPGNPGVSELASLVGATTPGAARFQLAAALPPMPPDPPPGPMATLAQLQTVALGIDGQQVGLRGVAKTKEGAEAVIALIRQGLDQMKEAAAARAKSVAKPGESAFDVFAPDSVGAEVSEAWTQSLIQNIGLRSEGAVAVVEAKLPEGRSTLLLAAVPMIGIGAAIAIPSLVKAKSHAQASACFANQKTVSAAIQMLDMESGGRTEALDAKVLETLRSKGYIPPVLDDPGEGPGTADHYFLTKDSRDGIACKVHGSIDGAVPGTMPSQAGAGSASAFAPAGIEGMLRKVITGESGEPDMPPPSGSEGPAPGGEGDQHEPEGQPMDGPPGPGTGPDQPSPR